MKIKVLPLILSAITITTCLQPASALANEVTATAPSAVTQEAILPEIDPFLPADDTTEAADTSGESVESAQLTLEEQQAALEAHLKKTEEKLKELKKSSTLTQEYIDTLDRKIGYINKQLELYEKQNNKVQSEIDELMPSIEENEEKLNALEAEVQTAQKEYNALQSRFTNTYTAYCHRLKIIYMTGEFNLVSALINCKDISSFLTRYEMIRSISKSDSELLAEVQEQMRVIAEQKDGLNEKKQEFVEKQAELDAEKTALVERLNSIEQNRERITSSKASLATDRAESDRLLAELTAQNKQYTEFRNEDSELIAAVENEIQSLIAGVKAPEEATTAVADEGKADAVIKDSEESDVYSKSDAVLNMTYPVPSNKSISAGFPNYSSGAYHGGIDFPCPTGSKVVAAQKGIVITVKRLNYSYGYYLIIYHGTDKSGRSVVSLYAHNSSILVNPGDTVKKGDVVAKSGSTGNSTGPHCHFEVRLNGTRVNPRNYLS